ncbi:hypothetical protein Bca52824_045790 [Brassica carinata]|uniref:Uncharacterized protein n=1 Tax=Brassica carinata TaxID=52824 RepID=A0A8X7UQJ6_BRACI|nr:hypothetical protein Bca52824_045790 [Brassica carinata]
MFKDIADAMREGFGACLKEIKYLSERVEAVEKKVINFIQKDTGEMFPKWEFDVEDHKENIIKLMFVKKPWKWTMDCWEVTGTWVNTKSAVVSPAKKKVVKEDSPRPRRKLRKRHLLKLVKRQLVKRQLQRLVKRQLRRLVKR